MSLWDKKNPPAAWWLGCPKSLKKRSEISCTRTSIVQLYEADAIIVITSILGEYLPVGRGNRVENEKLNGEKSILMKSALLVSNETSCRKMYIPALS